MVDWYIISYDRQFCGYRLIKNIPHRNPAQRTGSIFRWSVVEPFNYALLMEHMAIDTGHIIQFHCLHTDRAVFIANQLKPIYIILIETFV